MTQEFTDNCLTNDRGIINIYPEAEVFIFPASFAQQRLWFLSRLVPGNPFYNVSTALRLTGSLNLTALEQTFNEIVRRHETLRTTFLMVEGELMQAIIPSLTIPLPVIDLSSFSASDRETEARRLANEQGRLPFDLSKGLLIRITLLYFGGIEYVLLINFHHIVADGWSIGVLIREIGILYKAFLEKQPSPLPDLPIQYADFAEWQREWLQGEIVENQLSYWRQQLQDITKLNLPTDRARPVIQTYNGRRQFLNLPPALSKNINYLSQQENVTLFMTLLAAFKILLYRYTGQENIAVGSPIANRNRSEIEGLIGFFVNSLVLRTDLSENPTFRELLHRVKEATIEAYARQDLPFEKLVEELHPERDLSRNPLFQVSFSLQNTPIEVLSLPELTLSLLEFDPGTAKLDIEFHLWQDLENIKGEVIYSTDLFDDATITRMVGHYQTLLAGIVANPERRISELPLLTNAEREEILIDWNYTTSSSGSIAFFHQLFEAQVEQNPDAIAIGFENQHLTYRELNIRANQLARHLQKLGVIPDTLVGILLERSINTIVAILAIHKAGGAYLPLDPTYPQKRLDFMLQDAGVSILLTNSSQITHHSLPIANVICLDKEWKIISQYSQQNPTSKLTPENLAYVIYTSGSTGKPKGVQIQHRGLSNLALAQKDIFNIQPHHRILQFASLSFDASIFEIVMALSTGATLYLANKESLLPGQPLIKLLRDKEITHVTLPPAVLSVLPKVKLPALETIICAGEICSQDIVKKWANDRQFFNAYGPTEVTVWATIAEIKDDSRKPPIGRPIPNAQVYILDKNLQLVPVGIPGELYVGGHGVAKGYINLPELTRNQFIETDFLPGRRLYKTGDLGRYFPDGNIEFLGRIDEQVKIRGFRIELGEIEALLSQHPAVKKSIVIVQEKAPENQQLVAYIVPQKQVAIAPQIWRDFLKNKLPDYMIPSAFVTLDSLPLTPNGKVDRRHLTSIDISRSQVIDKTSVSPRNSTEAALAKIWSEVLRIEQVSVSDNFFDLGGDSLLAIRVMDKIEKHFNREISLSTLFLNPTVEGLANSLRTKIKPLAWSPLVTIQPKGSNPPFFCVHPVFGVVFPYYELAYNLGKNQPFYGLQPLGIDGKKSPLTSIEDMASYYIKALRVVQPIGPYFLGGWSFGGLVALEMAQQLEKAGDKVALLAIIDTLAPVSGNKISFWHGLKFLFSTAIRYVWPFLIDYVYLLVPFDNKKRKDMPQESRRRILKELTSSSIFRVFQANSKAAIAYVPKVYPGKITLFKSSEHGIINERNPTMGWSKLAESGVKVNLVPGNHLTMLRKPNVQVLAEQLRQCLEKLESN